ncbi:MAG: acyl carrier protein [Bacillota bacterium]|jgi:acyl carrier protein|nr:acyl carrier protein [Bacillota bacterium]HHU43840.1 acyl carrier protein [Clostridiales bacterium]
MVVFDKVKSLIAQQLGISESDITEDSSLVNDLGADSLDIVQMLISMEKEFGIVFDDNEIKNIKTVGDAVKFIDTHK